MTQTNLPDFPVATVVLVHAAWADASSWNKIIPRLQSGGLQAVAVQIPLSSLSDDAATLRRFLKRVSGPVVLVGHSYGGAVITAAGGGNSDVKALVYIAAMAPDEGDCRRTPASLCASCEHSDACARRGRASLDVGEGFRRCGRSREFRRRCSADGGNAKAYRD